MARVQFRGGVYGDALAHQMRRPVWASVERWMAARLPARLLRLPALALIQASLVVVLLTALLPPPPHAAGESGDWDIPNGHFFTQTGSLNDGLGYAVTNDGGIPLWAEYQRIGGVEVLGYPISQRFVWDNALAQATQRGVLVWRPQEQRAVLADILDVAAARGKDPWLSVHRGIPMAADWPEERAMTAAQVRDRRLALLDADPALRDRYVQTLNADDLLGLPTSPVRDFGEFTAIRTQRAVLRHWKLDDASRGVRAGETRIGNVGEDVRAAGLLPPEATRPQPAPSQRPAAAPSAPPTLVRDPQREPFPFSALTTTHSLDLLAPDAETWLRERNGSASVAAFDITYNALYVRQPTAVYRSASIIKVPIMLWTLERARRAGRKLTAAERELLTDMVQQSDNAAASRLLAQGGGAVALQRYLDSLGLKETRINAAAWGYSTTTAADMARLLVKLQTRQMLTPALCEFALDLMKGVAPEQRWGVTAGLPAGAQAALKNGWYPEDDGSVWRVHSIGVVTKDRRAYALAVLTSYPQDLGMDYGQRTIAGVAERVARALLGR